MHEENYVWRECRQFWNAFLLQLCLDAHAHLLVLPSSSSTAEPYPCFWRRFKNNRAYQSNLTYSYLRCLVVKKRTFEQKRFGRTPINLHMRTTQFEISLFFPLIALVTQMSRPASKVADQSAHSQKLLWTFAGRICHTTYFLAVRIKSF